MRSTSNLNTFFRLQTTDVVQIMKEFKKPPASNIFFKNKPGLVSNCLVIDFSNEKWEFNPMQFCEDKYQKQYLYPIILVCNSIGSIYEFNHTTLNGKINYPSDVVILSVLSFEKEIV